MNRKPGPHPRNRHHSRHDFDALTESRPAPRAFVRPPPPGGPAIDFADPQAARTLKTALSAPSFGGGVRGYP
ncbi:RlmF-related methyltransferase, partial [Cronobacter sakazakii]|uniref:RlmF-related methyltransferase n=1 Tax=Cronobacter sakazakii TaxID=28141 RepID=UPI000D489DB5